MRIDLGIVSPTPDLFEDAVWHAARYARGKINILGFGNGCDLKMPAKHRPTVDRVLFERSEKNDSIPLGMHRLWEMSASLDQAEDEDTILAYIHDDTLILGEGWDEDVRRIFTADPRSGLGGFFGAKHAGTGDIYRKPYRIDQLVRGWTFSNMIDAELYGRRLLTPTPIVLTDGFSMLCRRSLLDKIKGWSWWPRACAHHGYDLGMACMCRRHGYTAWLVPVLCAHFQQFPDPELELTLPYGGPSHVFQSSHRFVYDEFRDVLPMRVC